MSEPVLLINPRRRRVRARGAGGRFVSRRRRRRRNPVAAFAANPRRRRRRRRNPIALANPRRRRRRRNPIAAFAANPRRRRRRYYARNARRRRRYRNPRVMSARGLMGSLMPAATGAAGAVLLDVAMNYVPLPAQFQSPMWRSVARVGGAFGLGMVARFVPGVSRRTANLFTVGALTVAAYGIIRDLVAQNFPQLGLSGITEYGMSDLRLGYVNPAPMVTGPTAGNSPMGAYMRNTGIGPSPVGAYMRDSLDTVNSLTGTFNDGM